MDIYETVSEISEKHKLSPKEGIQLRHLLYYIRRNGLSLSPQLFNSRKTFLSNDDVLKEYIKRLDKKSDQDIKSIISNYNDMVNRKTQESQSKINQRKESYSAFLNENIDRKFLPGGPGFFAAEHSFNRGAKRQRESESENDEHQQKIGGKRTKHKRHNPKKTRRRYK